MKRTNEWDESVVAMNGVRFQLFSSTALLYRSEEEQQRCESFRI
jgi:hypothetical protein